jgi:biopolymer transport protein ExbB
MFSILAALRSFCRRSTGAIVLLGLICTPFVPASASWWNGDWQYRLKIDADTGPKGANIGERIGRTQILVRLLANNFKFDSAKPDGSDLRFIAGDDKTPLHYHIEKWDGLIDQVALVWVDVPDIAPGATTSFTMYWGNSKANDASDPHATYDADQLLIWHMAETSGPPKDSTAFGNNGQTQGRRDDTAIIGTGLKFDGTSTENLALSPTLNIPASGAYSWQAWVKLGAPTETATLFEQRDTGGAADLLIGFEGGLPFVSVTGGTVPIKAESASPLTTESWHLVSVVAAPEGVTLYIDGAAAAHAAGTLPATAGQATLGGGVAAAAGAAPTPAVANFVGQIDELQISKAARPAGAIAAADHSQGPQANLLSFEPPEETSSFGSGYFGIILRSVTADAWVVIGILGFMLAVSWLVMLLKGIYVTRVSGANKRFRTALQGVGKRARSEIMPNLPEQEARSVFASPLFRVYDVGQREVNERLTGGRTTPEGGIAPQSLAAIRSAMDAQMMRETQKLNAQMVYLTIAISGGPFVGLLGTVIGVMITFAAIAAQGDVNVNSIAPGISAALLATACGMFVAIPALFGYNYLQTRIKSVTIEMAVFVDEIVTRIAEGHIGPQATQLAE